MAALTKFASAIEDADVTDYRAVVTASARSAANAQELLDRVQKKTGIALHSVDGSEEARVVSLAVRRKLPLKGRSLLMDLGGGSLELTDLDDEKVGFTDSLEIGTVRIVEAFLSHGKSLSGKEDKMIREHLERVLSPHLKQLGRTKWDCVIGTGGNFVAAAKLAPATVSSGGLAISVKDAEKLLKKMSTMSVRSRREEYNLKRDRADVIVPALYVMTTMARITGASKIVVPNVGLKDGIAAELVEKHFRVWDYDKEQDKILGAAIQLGRRYHFDERHAMQVAALACDLFDGLTELHKLGGQDREILRVAAILHDIGDFVNARSHHKHTQYIIDNSDLMGLTVEDKALVALIARYHRRADPSTNHASFKALGNKARGRVRMLTAILRIADALDRGHSAKLSSLKVAAKGETVTLLIKAVDDPSLEAWTLDRKGSLFREVFEKKLALEHQVD